MSWVSALLLALGLAMDAFAVSLGIGTTGGARGFRPAFRLVFHFGLFQALMTGLGWLAGAGLTGMVGSFDHWIAMGLLAFVGIRMIRSGLDPDHSAPRLDPSRGRTLVILCIATSLDALAAGLSLSVLGSPILLPALLIGLVTAGLSLAGLQAGGRLGQAFGRRLEILGGVLLIVIGLRVVGLHLWSA